MNNLIIEVGKFYKTRDGYKVRIYATDVSPNNQIHGAILNSCGEWVIKFWPTAEGKSSLYPESVGDIVGEWEE